jgi:iron complex outermembrane receptor protein
MNKVGLIIKTGLFSLISVQCLNVGAQQEERENNTAGAIEEIIVMARRRAESLQDTPLSVTAISSEGMAARGIDKVSQVTEVAPNVVFEPTAPLTGSSNNGSIFIRGIGTSEFSLGTDPGVGLYVDDVYLARTSGNVMDIVDAAAIEVLRGPQGTLFGRNSIGGAIIIRSKRPEEELAGRAKLEYGTDDLWSVGGMVNLPLGDTVRSRFSILRKSQDGYVDDVANTEDFGSRKSIAGRATLEWAPTDTFVVTGRFDYTEEDNSAAPYVLLDLFDENPLVPGAPTFVAFQNMGLGCATSQGNTGGSCVDQYYIRGPHETVFGYSTDDRFLNDFNEEPFQSKDFTEVYGSSITLEWELGGLDLKSTTAYREVESRNPRNPDHTPFQVLEANSDLEQDQISTEFTVSGLSFDDRLNWVSGFFYMEEEGFQLDSVALWPLTLFSGGDFTNENWAVFGQGTYDLTESLQLTGGLRYTEEDKEFRAVSDNFVYGRTQALVSFRPLILGIPGATPADDKIEVDPVNIFDDPTPLTFEETTYHANLAWHIRDDLMTYASLSRGYKAGGFEQRLASPVPAALTFDPEFADAYEVGFKSTLLDNTLRLNGALFYTDYQDIQCAVVIGIAPTTINCGDAEILGVELEANWVPSVNWLVDASLGYLNAEWASGTLTSQASTVGILESNDLAMIPEWSLASGVSYDIALGENGIVTPRIDWSYRSEVNKDASNTPALLQDSYHLVNLGMIWMSASERYQAALQGRNITDEVYIMTGVSQPDGGFTEAVYSRGAEWRFSVQMNF